MAERKVLNKYYPPDFDPSTIPRRKSSKNKEFDIRIMSPFNMKCTACGEYIYKGRKFNASKEDVEGDSYLGLRTYRFYIKCTGCGQQICFKTDPKNTDYEIEAGATRNFMALKFEEKEGDDEEGVLDLMKLLEKRAEQTKREQEVTDNLEELKDLNRRKLNVDYDKMLQEYDTTAEKLEIERQQEEEVEQEVKEIFRSKRKHAGVENKIQELSAPSSSKPKVSLEEKRKKLGIVLKKAKKSSSEKVELKNDKKACGLSLLESYSGSDTENED